MNERIEALKKLATKEVYGNNPYNGAPEFNGYELDADMFAELLVRECLTFVEFMPGSCGIDDLTLEAAHNSMKKHFGVK